MRSEKNVLLILGASSDMGCAYIENLCNCSHEHEWEVIAQYRTENKRLNRLAGQHGRVEVVLVSADLAVPESVLEVIGMIKEKYKAPSHILHFAAPQFEYVRLKNLDSNKLRLSMEVQVYALAEVLSAFLPVMSKEKYGKVVVMLTAYLFGVPPKFMTDYIVAKYALFGLMKSSAAEYSDKGININAVSPAMVSTKFLNNIDERVIEMSAQGSPLKRNIELGEIVSAIDYLFSDSAACINGVNLNLSGGEYM